MGRRISKHIYKTKGSGLSEEGCSGCGEWVGERTGEAREGFSEEVLAELSFEEEGF